MTAFIKTCNTFSKFVHTTEQRRNVCVHTHARAHSYIHKYSDEKVTYTPRHSYKQIFIYSIICFIQYNLKNVICLNVFVKLKDQSILQKQNHIEVSLVTTKNN